tara:strand:+ start:1760 stop:1924 length:165 start_codon:yes stop_codon:yes gene_type:complete
MAKTYRVEQLSTMGWDLYDPKAQKLPKEQAKVWLESAMADGIKPSDLRAIPDGR